MKNIDQPLKKEPIVQIQSMLGNNKDCVKLASKKDDVRVISTGSYGVDKIVGVGGWPRGRIAEIYGAESTGKSTLTYKSLASCQKQGGVGVLIDLENSFDPVWAKKNGVDVDKLMISYPDSGEQAFTIINALVKTKMVDMIIVDSVAAMVPLAELNCELEDQLMGSHARMMGRGIRTLNQALSENPNCTVIFINQIRSKMNTFIPGYVTPGGFALKFAASLRLELKKADSIKDTKDNKEHLGHYIKVTVTKNKLAPPLKSQLIILNFDCGIDYDAEIIDHAINQNIIQKKGTWYMFEDKTLSQGLKNLKDKLHQSNDTFDKIKSLLS